MSNKKTKKEGRKYSEKEVMKIIKEVIHNPQVSLPAISYKITDVDNMNEQSYTSEYIDKRDFKSYLKRLEAQIKFRFKQ